MREHPDDPSHARRWLARGVMTLGAWVVAFLIIMVLFTVFGDELESLPLALRALVISGALAALMANLVMPVLSVAIAHWLAGLPRTQTHPLERGAGQAEQRGSSA